MSKETAPDLETLKARMKATWMACDFGQVAEHGEPEAEKFITRPATTQNRWTRSEARWKDTIRPYTKQEVERLRGTVIEYTLARLGAERLWKLLQKRIMCRHLER